MNIFCSHVENRIFQNKKVDVNVNNHHLFINESSFWKTSQSGYVFET
jgi:hypothetical protein